MAKTVIGLFDEARHAQQAVDELLSNGFRQDDIILTRNTQEADLQSRLQTAGIPEDHVRFYREGVRLGGAVLLVRSSDAMAGLARDILNRHNVVDVDARFREYQQAGFSNTQLSAIDEEGMVLPIVEEELQVSKRQVQRGGVRVHTVVSERPVEEDVTLREERVTVDRRPANRPVTDADRAALEGGVVEVNAMAEEAVVNKQARVIEEVLLRKNVQERQETVRDTVRRTEVDVEELDSARAVGARGFDAYNNDFRSYYQSNLTSSGYSYEQYHPVFRYGYDLANDPRYQGEWPTVESDARRYWEERNPGTWDRFKDSVRYAWSRVRGAAR